MFSTLVDVLQVCPCPLLSTVHMCGGGYMTAAHVFILKFPFIMHTLNKVELTVKMEYMDIHQVLPNKMLYFLLPGRTPEDMGEMEWYITL